MHYLFISAMHTSPWGGSEELWYLNALKKIKEGNTVSVLFPYWENPADKLTQLVTLGAKVIYIPNYSKIKISKAGFFDGFLKSSQLNQNFYKSNVNSLKPDIILISQGGAFSAARNEMLFEFLKKTHVPFILLSQQNIGNAFQSQEVIKRARLLHERCARWYFVSKQNRELAELQLAKNLDKTIEISNIPGFFSNSMLPFPKNQRITFSTIARLFVKDKGQDIILKALSSDQWKNRDWSLEFFGSGSDEFYLKELTSHLSLENKVEFKGKVSNVAETWKKNMVLLMGSRNEGTPLSLIEAFSVGRTAVATNIGGNGEWIENDFNGFLVKYPDPEEFLFSLNKLWEKKELLETFSRRAYDKYLNFDFSNSYRICDL